MQMAASKAVTRYSVEFIGSGICCQWTQSQMLETFLGAGASIVLVGGNQGLTNVEVLSFDESAPPSEIPAFPHPVSHAVGAFFNEEIFVCTGFEHPVTYYKNCYAFRTGGDHWEERPSLNHYRKG